MLMNSVLYKIPCVCLTVAEAELCHVELDFPWIGSSLPHLPLTLTLALILSCAADSSAGLQSPLAFLILSTNRVHNLTSDPAFFQRLFLLQKLTLTKKYHCFMIYHDKPIPEANCIAYRLLCSALSYVSYKYYTEQLLIYSRIQSYKIHLDNEDQIIGTLENLIRNI